MKIVSTTSVMRNYGSEIQFQVVLYQNHAMGF